MPSTVTGGCVCGAVRYEYLAEPVLARLMHGPRLSEFSSVASMTRAPTNRH